MNRLRNTLVLVAGVAWGQSAGTFVPTGKMNAPRFGHTATLLADGRVLLAGGQSLPVFGLLNGSFTDLASAEIYDPATGKFTLTGNMTISRYLLTSTALHDGRILIAGGFPIFGAGRGDTAELYDPATGRFTATGKMNIDGRVTFPASATLLANGKVLILASAPAPVSTAMLYDPQKAQFEDAGNVPLAFPRTATLLADGTVLLLGEQAGIYDPSNGRFLLAGNRTSNACQPLISDVSCPAIRLSNGNVLITGGMTISPPDILPAASAELFDPSTTTFRDAGPLLSGRFQHTATLLPGGRVLIAGGCCDLSSTTAELYDPVAGTFAAAGTLTMSHIHHTATLLTDGTVLIAGGSDSTAELYIPSPWAGSSASFGPVLASESLASLFGARLAPTTAVADSLSPPTVLGGISLKVRDSAGVERLAPLLYVSPSQINFEVPTGTAAGDVVLQIPGTSISVIAQARSLAPGIFAFPTNTPAAYAIRLEPNGQQTVLPAGGTITLDDRPVYLSLFGTGIRNRTSLANVRCTIGGKALPVEYAGPQGGIAGLDQVNVRLTPDLKGTVDKRLIVTVDGIAANTVLLDVR